MGHQYDLINAVVAGQPDRCARQADHRVLAFVETHPITQAQHPPTFSAVDIHRRVQTDDVSDNGTVSDVCRTPTHNT